MAVGLYDLLTWGRPFSSLTAAFEFTVVERASSSAVAIQPPLFYFTRVLFWLTPTLFPALAFAWESGVFGGRGPSLSSPSSCSR